MHCGGCDLEKNEKLVGQAQGDCKSETNFWKLLIHLTVLEKKPEGVPLGSQKRAVSSKHFTDIKRGPFGQTKKTQLIIN